MASKKLKMVSLKSSDGEVFDVDENVALQSQTIKHMIEDDCTNDVIPLPNVSGKILAMIIEYCKKHVEIPTTTTETDALDFSRKIRDDRREIRDHRREIRDHRREIRDHPRELWYGPREIRDHRREIRDHPRELWYDPYELWYGPREIRDHRREIRDHRREIRDDPLKIWDADFVKVDQATLFQLIMAANYLNIKSLLDLTTQTVADMFKGKTPDEICTTFNIKNDFTPEFRRENQWAFRREEEFRRENQWSYLIW